MMPQILTSTRIDDVAGQACAVRYCGAAWDRNSTRDRIHIGTTAQAGVIQEICRVHAVNETVNISGYLLRVIEYTLCRPDHGVEVRVVTFDVVNLLIAGGQTTYRARPCWT